MKRTLTAICVALALSATLISADKNPKVMTKENGAYVVNTTTLCSDVQGYVGTTPLKIYIRKNKVEKIEALPNQETPKYWKAVVKQMLDKWNGKKVRDAKTLKVDGRTGATLSSNALRENVRRGLEYYEKNK
jgi:electron transport complex protein RnfG